MKKADKTALLESFRDTVCKKSSKVDPHDEIDWYDLSLGFFLGKGASFKDATDLSLEARYKHHYWMLT